MNCKLNTELTVSQETANWLQTAPAEDIALAIEFGYPMIKRVERIVATRALSTVVNAPPAQHTTTAAGQVGEAHIESILREKFGKVTNVAKTPKSGDLTLYIDHRKIVVEVKNYSNPVPGTGVEKFQRDLITTAANGGIFVSLRSPITAVTSDFTIRYECAETKTVPCAYLVSSDAATIVVAVNMITRLLAAFDVLNAELYNKDVVLSGVYTLSDHLTDISRRRNEIQTDIGNLTAQMVKATSGLAAAESGAREAIDKIRAELFIVTAADVDTVCVQLQKNAYFTRQSEKVKAQVLSVIECVQSSLGTVDMAAGSWKISARKCVNTLCGVGITFLMHNVQVFIPRTRVAAPVMISALHTFGKKASINENLCIELDDSSVEWIKAAIVGLCKGEQ